MQNSRPGAPVSAPPIHRPATHRLRDSERSLSQKSTPSTHAHTPQHDHQTRLPHRVGKASGPARAQNSRLGAPASAPSTRSSQRRRRPPSARASARQSGPSLWYVAALRPRRDIVRRAADRTARYLSHRRRAPRPRPRRSRRPPQLADVEAALNTKSIWWVGERGQAASPPCDRDGRSCAATLAGRPAT